MKEKVKQQIKKMSMDKPGFKLKKKKSSSDFLSQTYQKLREVKNKEGEDIELKK